MLMLAGAIASRAPVKSADFNIITGVGKQFPFMGVLFFIGALGLAGIPPTNGFISKMLLFNSGIVGTEYVSLLIIGVAAIFDADLHDTRVHARLVHCTCNARQIEKRRPANCTGAADSARPRTRRGQNHWWHWQPIQLPGWKTQALTLKRSSVTGLS